MGGACTTEKQIIDALHAGQLHLGSALTAAGNKKHEEALKDNVVAMCCFGACKKDNAYLYTKVDNLLKQALLGQGDSLETLHQYPEARASYFILKRNN